jgi:carbon dioxide concentrating mechanism protein CcmN
MSVPPLHLISNFDSYISGEVMIDPTAAIAPGVVLQAPPNSRIVIAAGVCIGMGTVLHAHNGILEIESGAILGAGVLVVGQVKIGANACIGSATTILNCSIEPGQVVASGSLLGDTSRRTEQPAANHQTSFLTPDAASGASELKEPESKQNQLQPELVRPDGTQVVYGKAALNRLMSTLFPHRQSLSQSLPDGSSQFEDR